jgi:hypothetical protein
VSARDAPAGSRTDVVRSEACPEGIEYLGALAAIYSDDRTSNGYRMLWRYDSYWAQDHSAAELRGDTPFARLAREAVRFMDLSNSANRCNCATTATGTASTVTPPGITHL